MNLSESGRYMNRNDLARKAAGMERYVARILRDDGMIAFEEVSHYTHCHDLVKYVREADAQRALDVERHSKQCDMETLTLKFTQQLATLQTQLDAEQELADGFERSRDEWRASFYQQQTDLSQLQALVRGLPNCPGEIKVYPPAVGGICGTYDVRYDFRLESGSFQSIRLAMFHDECEADTYADLLKYRATLDATPTATPTHNGGA